MCRMFPCVCFYAHIYYYGMYGGAVVSALDSDQEVRGSSSGWDLFPWSLHVLPGMPGFTPGTPAHPHSPKTSFMGEVVTIICPYRCECVWDCGPGQTGNLSRM